MKEKEKKTYRLIMNSDVEGEVEKN